MLKRLVSVRTRDLVRVHLVRELRHLPASVAPFLKRAGRPRRGIPRCAQSLFGEIRLSPSNYVRISNSNVYVINPSYAETPKPSLTYPNLKSNNLSVSGRAASRIPRKRSDLGLTLPLRRAVEEEVTPVVVELAPDLPPPEIHPPPELLPPSSVTFPEEGVSTRTPFTLWVSDCSFCRSEIPNPLSFLWSAAIPIALENSIF